MARLEQDRLGAGLRPVEVVDQFIDLVSKVFPAVRQRKRRALNRLLRPAYDAGALRDVLSDVLGDRVFGESSKRLIIPSWDVHNGEVHVFKTTHHERLRRDWRIRMVDIALARRRLQRSFRRAGGRCATG